MKIRDVLDYVMELKEPAFSEKTLLRWLNQIEAEIQVEILLIAAEDIVQYTMDDLDSELIAPSPFDKLYEDYLIWRIHLEQEEAERANNAQAVFNKTYIAYNIFVCETIDPGLGKAEKMRYYLSAYGIAVKHGFSGTEKEWLASLKGRAGEPGSGLNIIGQVAYEDNLPNGMELSAGVGYLVGDEALLYIWDGKEWFYKKSIRGDKGEQGTPGIPGSPGASGRDGKDGKDGAIGPIGPQGPKGDAGPQGPQGQQGIQGDKGDPGDSGVYLGSEEPTDPNVRVWIDPEGEADEPAGTTVTAETIKAALGYTPADDSDVAALSDEKLDKKELTTAIDDALLKAKESGVFDGEQGPQGEKGEKGDTGAQGIQGEKGDKGDTGEQGIQGDKGDKGDTGAQGPQGEPGEAGYTPIKGVDYYTPAEKAEIVTDVKNAIGAVPEYWMEELTAGIEAINTKLCAAGKNKAAFLFYTDAHWNDGSQMSPTLLKYLHRHTGMNKTFFGGDIVSSEADDYDTMSYLWDWREQLKDLPNHHSVPGNHDDGNEINKRFDQKYMYGYLLAAEETPDVVGGENGLYYYIDSPAEKTRYLFLDTSQFVVDDEQKTFVTNALMTTPENWHIVAIAHIWVDADYTVTPPVPADINASAQELLTMFDNYNARSGVYAECTGWVEFCIGGHTHWDYDTTSETGIPIVLVETDSANVRSGLGFTEGTTTEASVNGIVADYDAKKIYVVRVGRGESREITVTTTIVTYTNQLPFALGFDGTILDGVGYKEDARLASTELGFRTATGYDCSGMIEVKQGDRVYLKNITWWNDTSDTNNYLLVSYRAEDFSSINQTYIVNIVGNSDFNATTDENGNVTSFTIPSWSSIAAIKYIMICAQDINSNSIITVNEPIE